MAAAPQPVKRDVLWERMQRGEQLVLIDALSPMSYAATHLPGAISMPPRAVDERAPRLIPDLETSVVVYCAGPDCDSSVRVAARLIELGYRNVGHYAGGKSEWADAGLPFEGGRVPA
jgi:rhodanese-related sulfurtransferase